MTHLLRFAAIAWFLSFAVLVSGQASLGQVTPPSSTQSLESLADRAEIVLDAGIADDRRLDDLRAELVALRAQARSDGEALGARLDTIQDQIAALGPAPEGDAGEPAEIASRRTALNAALEEARVPLVATEAAIVRASDLIERIDAVLRIRFSDTITARGPVPVLPGTLATAFADLRTFATESLAAATGRLALTDLRTQIASRWPFVLAMLVAGILLLFFVRHRLFAAINGGLSRAAGRGELALWGAALNLARTVVPAVAGFVLIVALNELNPGTAASDAIVSALPKMAAAFIVADWIGNSLFSPQHEALAVVPVASEKRSRGRFLTLAVAMVLILMFLLQSFRDTTQISEAAAAVVNLPLVVIGGFFLFPLARLIRVPRSSGGDPATTTHADTLALILNFLSRLGVVVAICAPVAALTGFVTGSHYLFTSFCMSYGLIGGLLVVFWLVREGLESWLDGARTQPDRDFRSQFRLLPVLVGMLLAIAALPVLALIWGARVSDISNVWDWLSEGVAIGDTRLSASDIVVFFVIFAVGFMATRAVQSVFRNSVLPRTNADIGARNAIVSGIGYVGIFLAAIAAISATGLSLSNLAIVAGALSIGVGFGLQTIVSNFVSGIILLVERPIKLGDWIEVSGYSGYVRRISVRATEIETFDRASVIVPNADLIANAVLNWTHSNIQARVIVPVGVAYGTDPRKIEALLCDIASAHPMTLREPAPVVVFQGFGADSLNFEIRAIVRDANHVLTVRSDLNFEIAKRFEEAGIEIPFPQRDVHIRSAGDLAGIVAATAAT